MAHKSEATPVLGVASRNGCGGCFRDVLNLSAVQAQFLTAAYHVRPELAVMIAALAFGGRGHG